MESISILACTWHLVLKKPSGASANPENVNFGVRLVKVLTLMIRKFFMVSNLHSSCCSGSLFSPSVRREWESLSLGRRHTLYRAPGGLFIHM